MLKDFRIGEAQDAEAETFEIGIPLPVVVAAFFAKVLPAIHFDDELNIRGIKVYDVISDGPLAEKLDAFDLFFSDSRPEENFGVGHVFPQPSRPHF